MSKKNLMILSDSPLGPSGLGRVGRELAQKIAWMPEFNLGYAALGGTFSRRLPYPLYPFTKLARDREPVELPQIWNDFAGDEKGVLLTIWNHTWLNWLLKPSTPEMKDFLEKVEVWAYVPVDSTQADGKLPCGDVLNGVDRVLAYTQFGADAIGRTTGRTPDILPHGTDPEIFHPLDKQECRRSFGLDPDIFLVGVVATNHERKDWGLAFETVSCLNDSGVNAAIWCHTDFPVGNWNLHELGKIHGVSSIITNCHYHDDRMAQLYGACDVTLMPGHEGWGLGGSESLACGVPCITGSWAGQTEFVPEWFQVAPIGFQQFGPYSFRRPVYSAESWAGACTHYAPWRQSESLLNPRFEWNNCWPAWENWLKGTK